MTTEIIGSALYTPTVKFNNSEIEILRHLALEGPSYKQRLRKKTGLGYATIHDAMKRLEGAKMIKVVNQEKWRTGLLKRTYDLTLVGLISLLSLKEIWTNYSEMARTIIRRKEMLPLVFGKWVYFEKSKLVNQIHDALHDAISHQIQFIATLYSTGISNITPLVEDLEDKITLETLLPPRLRLLQIADFKDFLIWFPEKMKPNETKIEEWFKVMLGDDDLRKYVRQKLEELSQRANHRLKWFRKWHEWFESQI